MIKTCNTPKCESTYQDKKYGRKKRVHNLTAEPGTYRCTVCEAKVFGVSKKDKKKEE